MTRFNTGNPIGSADPRDRDDNSKNLDEAVNDLNSETWIDRFGVERLTIQGALNRFNDVIIAGGQIFESEEVGRAAVQDGQYYYAASDNPNFSRTLYRRIDASTSELIANELAATDDNSRAYITALNAGIGVARRPGDDRNNYTQSLSGGDVDQRPPLASSKIAGGGSGRVVVIEAGEVLAQRAMTPLTFSDPFIASVTYGQNPNRPYDGVLEIGVSWYDSAYNLLSGSVFLSEPGGDISSTVTVRYSFGDGGADLARPVGSRYALPFARLNGGAGAVTFAELYSKVDDGFDGIATAVDTARSPVPLATEEEAHAFDFTSSFLTAELGQPVNRAESLSSDAYFESTSSTPPAVGIAAGSQVITSPVETAFRASEPLIFNPPCTFVFSHVSLDDTSSMAVFQHASGAPGRLQMRCNADAPTGNAEGSFNVWIDGATGGSGSGGQPSPAAHGVLDPGVFSLVLKPAPERSEFYRNGVLIDTFISPDVIYQGPTNILGQNGVISGSGGAIGRLTSFDRLLTVEELSKVTAWVAESVNAKIEENPLSEIQRSTLITATSGFCAIVRPFDFPQKIGSEIHLYPAYTKRPDAYTRPASLTKVLTSIVMLDHVTDLDATMTVQDGDATGGSGNNLNTGDVISYRDALFNMLLPSSNVTATVVARSVGETLLGGGSAIDKFVSAMNQRAQSLGMRNSYFANPHGLHADEMRTTGRDIAKLGVATLQYEALLETWGVPSRVISVGGPNARSFTVNSSVQILGEDRILGGKTGTLSGDRATNNLLVLHKLPGFIFGVSVVIGSTSDATRYTDMNNLIDEVEHGRRYFPNYLMESK